MVRAISNNNDSTTSVPRDFTPLSATKMLPLVRRIAAEMLQLTTAIAAQRNQLRDIDQLPETMDRVDYQEELTDIRGSLADDEKRLDDCRRELTALGLEAHVPFDGAIDFPSMLHRRRVRLCWVPEDDCVEYWHEIGQTRHERKRIESQELEVRAHN